MIILEENFKWHLEAFASELFIYIHSDDFGLIKLTQDKLKLQSVAFFGVKNDPKYIIEKMHNQPVFKTLLALARFKAVSL